MIEVNNLVKRYGNHLAVDHLSFQVEPGKIYGFLGPNGAGKSTTMNIMTGYIAPTEGTVTINGYDIVKDPEEAKKCIGYLPEIPPLYQEMTVKEYLKFVAELKKIKGKKRENRISEVMEMTMITEVSERLIRNLSKGYKQRVGLAQAILGYPEVIILDEPTVGLDPKQIIEIRELIKKLSEKHTIILSSHILSEVQAVCDEIMIISKGKLVACDTPEGLTSLKNGSATLEVHILGEAEKAERVIQTIPGVMHYTMCESHEKGCVKAVIETDAKEDIRVELFYALANEKMPILSMNRLEKSLEDIFLELTGDDGKETDDQMKSEEEKIMQKQTESHAQEGDDINESNL
ncbi:MAG: ABC transporter ATP-binding protein [Lachnospiraceae bacterium]|nr:ABC transporter ATP-binding protein [Lachnospiraceae bacterium]